MVIPNYIRGMMHRCAAYANKAADINRKIGIWLERHDVDVEAISNGDGYSFEELMYGNDVTDELCARIEAMEANEDSESEVDSNED